MEAKKMVTKQVEEVDDVLCDRCGESLYPHDHSEACGIHTILWGNYFSPAFVDGDEYEFAACEKCLLEWFKSFKNEPHRAKDGVVTR